MRATDPKFCQRLAQTLGMMGSAYDGEALNAARLADRMVRTANLSWEDLLRPALPEPDPEPEPEPTYEEPEPDPEDPDSWPGGWKGAVNQLLLYGKHLLTNWEYEFAVGLHRFPYLSEKQHAVLVRLLKRCADMGVFA